MTGRRFWVVALTVFAGLLVVATTTARAAAAALFGAADPHPWPTSDGHRRTVGKGQIRFDGAGPERWALRFRRERRIVNTLRRQLRGQRSLASAVVVSDPVAAIRMVFGPYADEAVRVARCESGFSTSAANGQYQGLFQMGARERALYGDGPSALEQARAAYAYFTVSGRDWSPWSCKP
jgi:hypothetical protein